MNTSCVNAILFTTLFSCILAEGGQAQGELLLYGSGDSCEIIYTEYIGRYPPNLPDMPWYIVNSYAAVDSVSRLATKEYIEDSLRNVTDEIVKLGWFNYILALDYNPTLLRHYWRHATYTRGDEYVTPPRYTIAAMMEEYYARFGEPDSNCEKILHATGGIYEIYVHSMAHRADTGMHGLAFPNILTQFWCATAIVEDVLFGQNTNFPVLELDGTSYQTIRVSTEDCTSLRYYNPDYGSPDNFTVPGHRYLLFADGYQRSSHDDLRSWWFFPQRFFRIDEAGNIHDPERFFGAEETLSAEAAKSIILSWKTSLLYGN